MRRAWEHMAPGWPSSVLAALVPAVLLWLVFDAPGWAIYGVAYLSFLLFRVGDGLREVRTYQRTNGGGA